jgi:Domain of unknown function (DUF4157)
MLSSQRRSENQMNAKGRSKRSRSLPLVQRKTEQNPLWQSLAMRSGIVQLKLTVSQADDRYEREADRVADQVMRMPAPPSSGHALSITPVTSRQAQRKCAECEEEEGKLQRKESSGAEPPVTAPPIVHEALSSSGQPLDATTRAYFEPRFGHDFSQVRVHTDQTAAASAQAINARAYTLRDDMVFGAGEYAPATASGCGLLAHELAHVAAQQLGAGQKTIRRQVPSGDTPAETPLAPQEILDDPAVRDAIDQVWQASFGHEPFDSTIIDLSDIPEAGAPEGGQASASGSEVVRMLGNPSYRDGEYEGVTFREAYFFVGADGKPLAIHVSQYPVDIKDVTIPDGARALVHTHPNQKKAQQTEQGGTLEVAGQLSVDEISAIEMKMPVYAVAEKDVLKTYQAGMTLSTERFRRSKLTKGK